MKQYQKIFAMDGDARVQEEAIRAVAKEAISAAPAPADWIRSRRQDAGDNVRHPIEGNVSKCVMTKDAVLNGARPSSLLPSANPRRKKRRRKPRVQGRGAPKNS